MPTPLPPSRTRLIEAPGGTVEYLTVGSGEPGTVFVHGLGGSIPTTRPFATGVPGTRTFLHVRGHGASRPSHPDAPDAWTYAGVADDIEAVAGAVGATQALGVSLGAGGLMHLLARRPDALEACVFVLPAVLDEPRTDASLGRFARMAALVDAGGPEAVDGLAAMLAEEQVGIGADPGRPDVAVWARRQAQVLAGSGIAPALRALPEALPLADAADLRRVTARCLVVGQEGDPVHPASAAERLAGLLPDARLEIFGPGGLVWTHRTRLREVVAGFLGA